jgi:hypothetical protein
MDDNAPTQPTIVDAGAVIGDQVGRLLTTVGMAPQVVAITGLRMIIGSMSYLNQHDKDAALELARFIGREMVGAVDELDLRGEATDGA